MKWRRPVRTTILSKEEEHLLENWSIDGSIILKFILQKQVVDGRMCGLDAYDEYNPVTRSYDT